MRLKFAFNFCIIVLFAGFLAPAQRTHATSPQSLLAQSGGVTAYDLIIAMNTLRVSRGLPPLIEDAIINAVAQSTAQTMAANQMSWHIGNVPGRLAAAGYGGGARVFATENFAVGNLTIDQIMVAWSDASHMIPAVNPAYCHVGAGVAKSPNGMTYYVLQAAYTSARSCGSYGSPVGPTSSPGGDGSGPSPVSQLIMPVKIATPDADGMIFHVVEAGQSFWAIAVAYQVTIRDLEAWNNLSSNIRLQIGQRLFIPSSNTEGYATPTPVGMVAPSTPDADGKIIHTVQSHQTLITIARAYNVTVDTILALNGIQREWPLQIGQKLLIFPGNVTPSPTPRPLTSLEKLTPDSDGRYYHVVKSGETLSWIAGLYEVTVNELVTWNPLINPAIIRPDQKLLLQVTPPSTPTFTLGPPTATPTLQPTPIPATATPTRTQTAHSIEQASAQAAEPGEFSTGWFLIAVLAVVGLLFFGLVYRRKI